MDWLKHLKSWSEVRRFLFIIVPVTGGMWFAMDKAYDNKLEDNLRNVHIDESIQDLAESVSSIATSQDSLTFQFTKYVQDHEGRTNLLRQQVAANQKAFLFSIEHQGDITRSAMIDMVGEISEIQKKTSLLENNSFSIPPQVFTPGLTAKGNTVLKPL